MEDRIQADIVKFLRHQGIFCHSVPNEGAGRSNAIRTAQLVTMGLFSGVGDLIVWWTRNGQTVVGYLEVKTATGRQSDRQKHFEELCLRHNVPYHVVRSLDDVKQYMEKENFR